jgi:cytochrome P450
MRRNLAYAFSDKSLREQESLLQEYADLLVQRLNQCAAEGKSTDIVRWYKFLTFDVISDLAFGEPLYCLRDAKQHIWIDLILGAIKASSFGALRQKYTLMTWCENFTHMFKDNQALHRIRSKFYAKCSDKVRKRLDARNAKPDFFLLYPETQRGSGQGIVSRGNGLQLGYSPDCGFGDYGYYTLYCHIPDFAPPRNLC